MREYGSRCPRTRCEKPPKVFKRTYPNEFTKQLSEELIFEDPNKQVVRDIDQQLVDYWKY